MAAFKMQLPNQQNTIQNVTSISNITTTKTLQSYPNQSPTKRPRKNSINGGNMMNSSTKVTSIRNI